MTWTPERVELLKVMHGEGLSAAMIASTLGDVTRNGVIGKLSRMGYSRPFQPSTNHTNPRKRGRRKPIVSRAAHVRKQATYVEPVAVDKFLGVSLLDLRENQCRYPQGAGPFLFCGQPKLRGSSYCPRCYRVCYGGWNGPNVDAVTRGTQGAASEV